MKTSEVAFNPLESSERIDQVDYRESADLRIQDAALDVLREMEYPDEYGLSKDRISNFSAEETFRLKQAAAGTGLVGKGSRVNVALAIIRLSLMVEGAGGEKLQRTSRLIKTNLNQINLLQNLSDLLPADVQDSYNITPEMRTCFDRLKGQGIDLLTGNKFKITKAEDSKLRSQISSEIGKRRSLIEEDVRGMGIEANKIERILKIVQKVIDTDERAKKKANDSIPR
jgi:hypothetical protein